MDNILNAPPGTSRQGGPYAYTPPEFTIGWKGVLRLLKAPMDMARLSMMLRTELLRTGLLGNSPPQELLPIKLLLCPAVHFVICFVRSSVRLGQSIRTYGLLVHPKDLPHPDNPFLRSQMS
ncbi:unnamed protein product [Cochlearia groenlandica]